MSVHLWNDFIQYDKFDELLNTFLLGISKFCGGKFE